MSLPSAMQQAAITSDRKHHFGCHVVLGNVTQLRNLCGERLYFREGQPSRLIGIVPSVVGGHATGYNIS